MNDIQRAIETQKSIYNALDRSLINSDSAGLVYIPVDRMDDIKTAISAMEELQQYRELGSVDELAEIQNILLRDAPCLREYKKIGSPEECREAREKQKAKKPTYDGDGYAPDGSFVWDEWLCPQCGSRYEVDYDDYDYCPECGQHIDHNWEENDGEINNT